MRLNVIYSQFYGEKKGLNTKLATTTTNDNIMSYYHNKGKFLEEL